MTLEVSVHEHTLLTMSILTRIQRVENFIEKDGHKDIELREMYIKELNELKELYDNLGRQINNYIFNK